MADGGQIPNPHPVRPFRLRARLPWTWNLLLGLVPLVVVMGLWFGVTYGEKVESRLISSVILPSPVEVAVSLKSLWFERALMRSILYSLGRVGAGFGVAVLIALPLGVAMAAFSTVRAVFNPVAVIGGYLPIAALVPLTLSWFGTNEPQKIAFLAIASLAILGSLLQLVGLVQVPETLLPVLPEPSEEAKEYYLQNPHFLEISLNIHAFGRGLAIFKQALFALANVGLGAWFWKVLVQPSVVEMLQEAKEARAAAKGGTA